MKWVVNLLLPLVLVAAAALAAKHLIETRPAPPRVERPEMEVTVEVVPARAEDQRVAIQAMGTVIPARQLALQAEVAGRIVELSPALQPGGIVRAGALLLRIDPRDYQYQVDQRRAQLEKAIFDLKVEEGRHAVAAREWGLLAEELRQNAADPELARREPHLRNAQAALTAARSALDRALLDVERTTLTAPFDSLVLDETVETGLLVSPQSRLATLVGTASFWVQASIPVDRLFWIQLPRGESPGAPARVTHDSGGQGRATRSGRVVRLLGDLEPAGRMARLLVAVDDPLGLQTGKGESQPPLLLGAYVQVEIEGDELAGAIAVPRAALHDGDRIWVRNAAGRLEIRTVRIRWRDESRVLLAAGLEPGEEVVVSPIPIPMPGLKLRVEAPASRPGARR